MSDSSLKYLNSEQALADLAAFSQSMAWEFNLTNSKWISFGGSYPGSLSAWFRLKYPHLVHGGCLEINGYFQEKCSNKCEISKFCYDHEDVWYVYSLSV